MMMCLLCSFLGGWALTLCFFSCLSCLVDLLCVSFAPKLVLGLKTADSVSARGFRAFRRLSSVGFKFGWLPGCEKVNTATLFNEIRPADMS
jgi:hypothetical protein